MLYRDTNNRLDYPIYTRFEVIRPGSDGHIKYEDHSNKKTEQKQMKYNTPSSNINTTNGDADKISIKSVDLISECYSSLVNIEEQTCHGKNGTMSSTSKPTAIPTIETPNDLCSSTFRPSHNSHDVTCDDSAVSTPELIIQPALPPGYAMPSNIPATS